jgi:hypothetical protein
MPAAPRIGTVLAERRLVTAGDGAAVRVAIGVPRRDRDGVDWACPFRIHGAGVSRVEYGYGVDSMQALATALEGIRVALDQTGLALGWNVGGGAVLEDETGFTRSIFAIGFGPAFRRRVERLAFRLLDREVTQEVRRLKARAARRRSKASKAGKAG